MSDFRKRVFAIIGNPNTGKTALFNALTGLRQKVANYPGVTVERKEGQLHLSDGSEAVLIDLPGAYSLSANSPDEKIAVDVLLGRKGETPKPDLVICVVDASNLERNLFLVSQIIDLHLPVVVALNMIDVAEKEALEIDIARLSEELGVRVVATVATSRKGIDDLREVISAPQSRSLCARRWRVPEIIREECIEPLDHTLQEKSGIPESEAFHEALTLLTSAHGEHNNGHDEDLPGKVKEYRARIRSAGLDATSFVIESRYEWIQQVIDRTVLQDVRKSTRPSDRVDAVLTHRFWGLVIFFGLMALMFQTIFTWAEVPMNLIGKGIQWLGREVQAIMPPGDLRDLIVNGVFGGVGAVVTFLPQIMFLFLFLGILEDSGYMARAAFIMDRLMSKVGLHGRSFIPLLSSFACAIPGIMATRTIENRKDRLVTMLVAPLMSCSARLPVYALMIAAFIPQTRVFGILGLPGLTLVSMYFLGLVTALSFAWLFKKTLLKSETPVFIMELPPYRVPSPKSLALHAWDRSCAFVKRAGTFILGVSIILWFLATYPKLPNSTPADQLAQSFAGRAGKLIEPVIKPLGFNWKIGIGLIGSILQREVFVSTMGTIYGIADAKYSGNVSLQQKLQKDVDPATGLHVFTALTAICLMVYYVLAMQCMSTVAVARRESNSWKWPAFLISYMTVLAWVGTFVVYRIGLWIS